MLVLHTVLWGLLVIMIIVKIAMLFAASPRISTGMSPLIASGNHIGYDSPDWVRGSQRKYGRNENIKWEERKRKKSSISKHRGQSLLSLIFCGDTWNFIQGALYKEPLILKYLSSHPLFFWLNFALSYWWSRKTRNVYTEKKHER